MPTAGIKVLFIGREWDLPYECRLAESSRIFIEIARFNPDVIVTSVFVPGNLKLAAYEIRKKWIHVEPKCNNDDLINAIESCYRTNIWGENPNDNGNPLISIYTGTYNTGDVLRDTYQSLKEQIYPNWEWVVVDDGSTDDTWNRLLSIANEDIRVRPFQMKHVGKIGNSKDVATRLCNGEFLIELDHDDMLADMATQEIKEAFRNNPDVGMVYTNCACFFPDGSPQQYADNFWKDRYRETEYKGKVYLECISPNIYDRFGPRHCDQFGWFLTVGPNHIRAYRAETLRKLGGYNRNIPVADDWDVFARFFLYSKCLHVDKMLYLYRFHDNYQNTTFIRNKSIQDHLALGRDHYEQEFIKFNEDRLKSKVSFVVLDWNTKDMTIRCLEKIRHSKPDSEIILIQNGEEFDTDIADVVMSPEINLGFAAGCNLGASRANGNIVFFINSDTFVEPLSIQKMIEEFDDNSVGCVGPYSDHAKSPQGNHKHDDYPERQEVDMISGFCMAIRRDLFFEIGGFDPQFCNFEDDDLCKRVMIANYRCVVADCWVHHEDHQSFIANGIEVNDEIEKSRIKFKKKWPKIKVIILTYNEEDALPGFVEQYKDIVDEICILDSNSTDGTINWARENNIKISHRVFDRFDNQRNAAIEKFAGDADWIIMHDPDERLDENTLNNIYELARSDRYDIYLSPLVSVDENETEIEWVPKPFMFRNKPEIRWIYPVHEKLVGSMSQAIIKNAKMSHILSLHDRGRRCGMLKFYSSLGDDAPRHDEWPILNYNNRDDDRIDKIYLGPPVSVIVPTYNRPDLLKRAIESINKQNYLSIETIIVGDNCPFLDKIDLNADKIINLPNNHGAGGAVPRNYGIYLSSSRWIAYLDDDNCWREDHISSLMNKISETGSDFAISSMDIDGFNHICDVPERGKVDTSCLIHRKNLVYEFEWWKDRAEATYAHDWAFVEPWVRAGCKWSATLEPTVIYNKDTSGQKEYLEQLLKKIH